MPSAASSRTRSARATTSRSAWSNMRRAIALFPEGHPYRHSTIGSMADLDAASLEDVKGWFRQHYGPNNAILALAGDIDAKTARPLVEKYFGNIARGPAAATVAAPVPTLPAPRRCGDEGPRRDHAASTATGWCPG